LIQEKKKKRNKNKKDRGKKERKKEQRRENEREKENKRKKNIYIYRERERESIRNEEIKSNKGEDAVWPDRHQPLHLRSSSSKSVLFFSFLALHF
jgi:hypothetical protein